MKADFWIERWEKGEIGFHQASGNDLLVRHWSAVHAAAGRTVFVPLCGKSVDMAWLAAKGYRVIGSELSQRAVADFFHEQGAEAQVRREGAFEVSTAGPIEIWCGDFFAMPTAVTRDVAAVYDRAALIAMPPEMQPAYVAKLRALVPAAPILLVSLDYPAGEVAGPPFATPEQQIRALFAASHDMSVLETRDGLAASPALKDRGVTRLDETAYVLRPRTRGT